MTEQGGGGWGEVGRWWLLSVLRWVAMLSAMPWAAAWGCSCERLASAADAFHDSGLVFVGRVTGSRFSGAGDGTSEGQVQTVTVRVLEPFKGVAADDEVTIRRELSFCHGAIPGGGGEDVPWLFYLQPAEQPGTWDVPTCHRTLRLSEPTIADDFSFLRGLPESGKRTRVSGTVMRKGLGPAAGVGVRVVGMNGLTAVTATDTSGVYETFGLPAGVYRVEIAYGAGKARVRERRAFGRPKDLRKTWKLKSYEIELDGNSGAGVNFELEVSSSVTGRLLDPEGRPIQNVCVALDTPGEPISGCSDENGTYQLEWAPAGTYYLVANPNGRVAAGTPFPRVYFPGRLSREEAAQVTLGEGDQLTGMDIRVPQLARLVKVAGRVAFADGTPVPHAPVEFRGDVEAAVQNVTAPEAFSETSDADADGAFSLQVPAGLTGEVRGYLLLDQVATDWCPEWKDMAARAAVSRTPGVVESPSVRWKAGHTPVRIVFPFASCRP